MTVLRKPCVSKFGNLSIHSGRLNAALQVEDFLLRLRQCVSFLYLLMLFVCLFVCLFVVSLLVSLLVCASVLMFQV